MSYYMGDYYRGDPGIGSFLGGLFKKAVRFIPGVGPVAETVMDAATGLMKPKGPAAAGITAAAQRGLSQIAKHPVLTAAAGAAVGGMAAGAAGERMMGGAMARAGRGGHVLKRCGTVLKSGRPAKCHRSMNVCNPKALRKAIRRTRGFAKLAMKTIHIIHPKKKGRFGGFKTRRRK